MLGLEHAAALTVEALGGADGVDPVALFALLSRGARARSPGCARPTRACGHGAHGGALAAGEDANLVRLRPAAHAGRVDRGVAREPVDATPPTTGATLPGGCATRSLRGRARRARRGAGVSAPRATSCSPTATTLRGLRGGLRARRRGHDGRVRLQHRDERLPGGPHRPELRRPGHRVHLPAHRQLRRHAARRRVDASVVPGLVVRDLVERPRRAGASVGPLEGFLVRHRRPGDRRASTRGGSPGTCAPHGALPGAPSATADPTRSRAAARGARRRPTASDLVTGVSRREPYAMGAATADVVVRSTTGSRRRSSASSPRGSASRSCRRTHRAPRSARSRPTASSSPTAPATRRRSAPSATSIADLLGDVADLRDLPRPPAARRRRSARRPTSCPSATTARNHPVQDLATGRVEITAQNHNYAVDARLARRAASSRHVEPQRRRRRGVLRPRRERCFCVQYHPEAGPGPHDARYLFDALRATAAKAARWTAL